MTTRIDLPNGVMLNAYPDSIGEKLSDIVDMLKRPEFDGVFSLFYILPTIFHSDLDRGFSVIDYGLNEELVSANDLAGLDELGIGLKFDLVLNHLSVGSPQFQDMLANGDASPFKDFFIDWNDFWAGRGTMGADGHIVPNGEDLEKLFMRKPGLPILDVRFPDGSERPYWNTFYQEVGYPEFEAADFSSFLGAGEGEGLAAAVNSAIAAGVPIGEADFGVFGAHRDEIVDIVESRRRYLGQMDLNAGSQKVWDFYDETLERVAGYGARMVRLDAFAYLHKEPGQRNFFNKPGTWDYLARLKDLAEKHGLVLLPEIHARYGEGLHEEVAAEGFPVYDFFFPGLVIDALDRCTGAHLLDWVGEIEEKGIRTVNMLGCHDGIPVLDLGGRNGEGRELLGEDDIEAVVERIMARGGRVKNLFGPDGRKIAYYQVNATFFSALGEDERKLRLARAIQLFMPGIPQVWYLDLFAGKNDYAAADRGGTGGHKEINRTTLTTADIEAGLATDVVRDQLALMRLRNSAPAFAGSLVEAEAPEGRLRLRWRHGRHFAELHADLCNHHFAVTTGIEDGDIETVAYN